MSVEIRRGTARFTSKAPGRQTRHSFSFGEHYDPERVAFGPMVCHDDHRLAGGAGFDPHRHADLEIVSWVLDGAIEHADDRGHADTVTPGSAQVLSAGSGVEHSERAVPGRPARFVQVWLTPDAVGFEPSYDVRPVELPSGALVRVAAGDGDAPVRLGTSGAAFSVARLEAGDTVTLPGEPLQHVFVGRGALTRSSLAEPLHDGDAFLITDEPGHRLTAAVSTELLVWTFA